MKLVTISLQQAHWLGNSLAVAGGWVMVPGEWANGSRLMERVQAGLRNRVLAAIPDGVGDVSSAEPFASATALELIDLDIAVCRRLNRPWSLEQAATLSEWRERLAAV